MLEWVYCFRRKPLTNNICSKDPYFDSIFTDVERNILLIGNRRNQCLTNRFILWLSKSFYSTIYLKNQLQDSVTEEVSGRSMTIFDDVDEETKILTPNISCMDYDEDFLEKLVRSKKGEVEEYDVPTSLLIVDSSAADNASFNELITEGSRLRMSTLSIMTDISNISKFVLSKMDVVVFLKDKNKKRQTSKIKNVWERKYKERLPLEQFQSCVQDSTGGMKAAVITSDGMYVIKLNKTNCSITNVCAFKPLSTTPET